ncbi:MAG: TIGR03435 family protein [Terracidiphilus sp.]
MTLTFKRTNSRRLLPAVYSLMIAAVLLAANVPVTATQAAATTSAVPAPAQSTPPAQPAAATPSGSALDIVGTWQGTLHIPQANRDLRTEIKIARAADGSNKLTFYSIDQGGRPTPATKTTFEGGVLTYSIDGPGIKYEGKMSADGKTISGATTQGTMSLPLNLERVTADAAWPIPEPPKPMAADANPKFDVVTIKPSDPNRPGKLFTIRGRHVMTINTTVNDLITFGYSIQIKQMVNAPAWFDEKYDIDGVPDVEGQPNIQQMRILIRDALVERFNLKFHNEQRELSVYALTVARGGPKLTVTTDKPSTPGNFLFGGLGRLRVTNSTMTDFCHGMQEAVMDKPVVDQTGLTDRYDFNLNWTPDQSQFAAMGGNVPPPNTDDPNAPPSLYIALQEQLGLKLENTKANADVMVIDQVEKPSQN